MRMTIRIDTIIWILTVVLFSSFTLFEINGAGSAFFVCTALIFLFIYFKGNLRIKIGKYQIFSLLFAVYCCLTSIWAENAERAFDTGTAIFKIIICFTIIYSYYNKEDGVRLLTKAVMWSGYVIVCAAYSFEGVLGIIYAIGSGRLIGNSFANINTIALDAAIAIVLSVFFMMKKRKLITLYVILDVLAVFLIAASGSRKSLVFTIAGVVIMIMMDNISKDLITTIIKWILLIIIMVIIVMGVLSLPAFTAIKERMFGLLALLVNNIEMMDHSAWLRQEYARVGLEQFKKTPWIGIGMDNTYLITMQIENRQTYLHNNFIEILAGGGILGFILFYINYVYLLICLWSKRKIKNDYIILCVIWIILLLVIQYGIVVYYDKHTYMYMLIFHILVEQLRKGCRNENKKVY